jgi:putative ABC transport system permease protein
MDYLEILKLSLSALRANKVRSFLTMLGIIIGVAAVILLISLGSGLQNYITQQFESLGANSIYVMPGKISLEGGGISQGPPNFAGSKLTLTQARDIKRMVEAVTETGAGIEMSLTFKYGKNTRYAKATGVTDTLFDLYNMKLSTGKFFTRADVDQKRKVAVIGATVQNKLFGNINPIGKSLLIGDERYEVVGITQELGMLGGSNDVDNAAFIPITCAQDQFGMTNVMYIVARARDKDSIDEAKTQIKRYLLKKNLKEDDFTVMDQGSLLSSINQILGVLTMALGGIAAISLLVGGIGIMNIMLVSVTERTREIGLRKAVGATSADILSQFLTEAIVLCLAGGTIGILLGTGGSLLAKKVIPTTVPLWAVILAFGFSTAVGLIFGVAPAYKAAKLDPIEALRYE